MFTRSRRASTTFALFTAAGLLVGITGAGGCAGTEDPVLRDARDRARMSETTAQARPANLEPEPYYTVSSFAKVTPREERRAAASEPAPSTTTTVEGTVRATPESSVEATRARVVAWPTDSTTRSAPWSDTKAQVNPEFSIAPVTPTTAPTPRARQADPNDPANMQTQIMTRAMRTETSGTVRGAAVNVVQASFALEGADFDPDTSADGSKIVFASTQHRSTADLYIKDVQGRTVTQLTTDPGNDIMPRISPDGTRIAFASDRSGAWNLYVMPIGGGRAIQVTGTSADDLHPSWSPDGTQLVFSRMGQMSGQWEMWITDVANAGVSKFIGYGLFPEWCPTARSGASGGDLIAFQRSRERGDRSFALWTLEYANGQAGNTTEVASSPNAACINPTWSRDGQWLAFSTVPNASQWAATDAARPPQADLWMVDLGGTQRINLTSGLALNLMPRFGTGNKLYFVSDRGGTDNIWVMDTTPVMKLAALNGTPSAGHGATAKAEHAHEKTPEKAEVAGAHEEAQSPPDEH